MSDALDDILASYNPLADWPNCETPDCEAKVCTWAHRTKCGRCAGREIGEDEMRRRYDATHEHSMAWSDANPDDENIMLWVWE